MFFKENKGIVYACRYRIVWCVKYLRPVLTDGIDLRLQELLCDMCQQKEITLIKVHVESNLVDLVIELPPQHGVHNAVKQMKRYLSHCLRQEFPALKSRLPTLWSNAYFITTCGRMGKNYYEMMQDFLQRQKPCKNNGKKKQP